MTARAAAIAVALAGCNRVFDLQPTRLPPPDAPAMCPPLGQAPPFSTTVRQAILQPCNGYTISGDRALALANCPANGVNQAALGALDGPLAVISLAPTAGFDYIANFVLSPEGDEIYAQQNTNPTASMPKFAVWTRNADDTWSWKANLSIPGVGYLSPPSRGPMRHLIVSEAADGKVHEYVGDAASWTEVMPPYDVTDLGIDVRGATMTSDGLRLVFEGAEMLWYTDRAEIGSRFHYGSVLMGLPYVIDPYMTDDCARLYFSGLGNVLYVDQQ